jgi:hypothetical protein
MTGKRGVVAIKRSQQVVSTGFSVPAREKADPAVELRFWMEAGEPYFGVRVEPWKGYERAQSNEEELRAATIRLGKAGFHNYLGEMWSQYSSPQYLESDDVAATLLELVRHDVRAIARSDILRADVKRFRPRSPRRSG